MKRVLVIGADDFIGGRVASALAACGWATPLAGVPRPGAALPADVAQVPMDPTDPASVAQALHASDAVVNCLTGSPESITAAAKALFTAAGRMPAAPLVVQLSSMSVYGSASGDVVEDTPLRGHLSPYASARLQSEVLAVAYGRALILRPGCEYGPQGQLWSGRIARWLCAARVGDLGAAGDGYCNLLHVDDLAAATLRCLQRPELAGAVYNLAMPGPPTWNEYFIRFGRALGAVPVRRISARRLAIETKVLAAPLKALEMAAAALGLPRLTPPPIPPSLLRQMRQEIRLISRRAERDLAWSCRPLDEGLAETADWFLHAHARSANPARRALAGTESPEQAPWA